MKKDKGFTVVELMVALVIGGLLMASLVALSGMVQRSFGKSKDITELQASLRFAMQRLRDDLQRSAFMYLAKPDIQAHVPDYLKADMVTPSLGWNPVGNNWNALAWDNGTLILRGNYLSSRDYKIQINPANGIATVVCDNLAPYNAQDNNNPCGTTEVNDIILNNINLFADAQAQAEFQQDYKRVNSPFGDGGSPAEIFQDGQVIRIEHSPGRYTYHQVQGQPTVNVAVTFSFSPAIDADKIKCPLGDPQHGCATNPIMSVQYQLVQDPADSKNWLLQRTLWLPNGQGVVVDIADYLLPYNNAVPEASGFFVEVLLDRSPNFGFGVKPWQAVLDSNNNQILGDEYQPITAVSADDLLRTRAVRITLRARTEVEFPEFTIQNFSNDDPDMVNYGYDVDNNPQNGLARVRVHREIIQMRNLGLNLSS